MFSLINHADISECSVNNGYCEHECMEMPGSYSCNCEEGYRLAVDNHSCEGISNEYSLNYIMHS